jgi:Protein of unknown function (DUF4231)
MSDAFRSTWEIQARWSTTANVLKRNLGRARTLVLLLTIAGAVLVTLGGTVSGFDASTGKALGLAGAAALALAPLINKRSASGPSVGWVRARPAAERLKTELYFYLTRTGLYEILRAPIANSFSVGTRCVLPGLLETLERGVKVDTVQNRAAGERTSTSGGAQAWSRTRT